MIDRIARRLGELSQQGAARKVLATPPIVPTREGALIFSMIGTRVLLPYLVAVKSLHARLGAGRVAILDDGTLTREDRRILAQHCGDPQLFPIRDVDRGDCPQGGCWERLLTLLGLTRADYVIQLDSDTVTLGAIGEVIAAVAANRSFTLLGGPDAEADGLQTLPAFSESHYPAGAIAPEGVHVQAAIEGNWRRYPQAGAHRYVRGCAGFAGFARGGPGRGAAEAFSREAAAIVGAEKWRQWGSEQVASNFLIANSPAPVLLPYARYSNYWNATPDADTRFLHFVGTHRYAQGEYRRATREAIAALG